MIIEVGCPVGPFFSSGPTVTCSTTGIANIPMEGKVSENLQKGLSLYVMPKKRKPFMYMFHSKKSRTCIKIMSNISSIEILNMACMYQYLKHIGIDIAEILKYKI